MPTQRKTRAAPRYRLTDVGNSLRFTADHTGRLIYVTGPGWHAWDGKRWRLDNESAPYRAAKETAHRIRLEATAIEDEAVAAKVFAWGTSSESAGRIKSMVDLARRGERTTEGLLTDLVLLDAKPHLLTCVNGTIDLKTGKLRQSDPEDYITRLVKARFDPGSKAPRWSAFLREVFQDDEEMIAYVHRAVGYSLTGETSEQVMFLAYGDGANGKSVFMETVAEAAGEWAVNAATETFASSARAASVPNDLARMRGARLVRAPETEDGAVLARQIIKRVTGGDAISARLLFREWFEYYPAFKVWLVTNHLPGIPVGDFATWRRIRLIPFVRTFDAPEQDKRLRQKLRREMPGILAWAVEGARLWYREGLGDIPLAARIARDEYRASQDTVGRFCDNELVDDGSASVPRPDAYAAYKDWCRSESLQPIGRNAFHGAMRNRGYQEAKIGSGTRVYQGVRLT